MAKETSYEKPYNLKKGADTSISPGDVIPEVEAEQYRRDHDPEIRRFREKYKKNTNQDFW